MRVPVLAGKDVLEAVQAGGGIDFIVCAQQSNMDGVDFGEISAAYVGVRVRQLADHLAEDVGERIAVGHVGEQLRVLIVDLLPVHSVHGGFEEVVTLLAPDFVVHFFPFLGRINLDAHAA